MSAKKKDNGIEKWISMIPAVRSGRFPSSIGPMLATLVDKPFDDPKWIFENKWDGVRAICYLKHDKIKLITRNQKEVAFRYPELAGIIDSFKVSEAILDGEIITSDEKGRSVFQWLQSRIGLKEKNDIEAASREHPAIYCVFDVLYCEGYDLRRTPLLVRKELLSKICHASENLILSDYIVGKGNQRFRKAEREKSEGIIAKLADSPYFEGRSAAWLKIKTTMRQEVVIAGYTAPQGAREFFGALLAGLYDGKELKYVGHVGGGFDQKTLKQVYDLMRPLETDQPAFESAPRANTAVKWLKPKLVCEVKFAEWTAAGILRQPIFQGIRDDKKPEQCRVERAHHAKREKAEAAKQTRAAKSKEAKVSLKTYREKRDFTKTKEPKGKFPTGGRKKSIFVIHEHHSSVMHFDLRLEIDGTLKSWSVPKGPTLDPGVKRLAVEVEDHPLEYAKFNGEIAEGQYGAGKSLIWDEGEVQFLEPDALAAWDEGRISFTLKGKKLKGEFALVEMKGRKGKPPWLLMKKKDEYADPDWRMKLIEADARFAPEKGKKTASKSRKTSPPSSAGRKKKSSAPKNSETTEKLSAENFLKREDLEGAIDLKVGNRMVSLTHLEKLYWPKERIRKGDLLQYYLSVGDTMIPHLKGRPAILKRYPNGIEGESFFQHDVQEGPSFLKRELVKSVGGRRLHYAVYTDVASLLYLVNLGVIAQHAWISRIDHLDRPDYVVFDLDPKGAPFRNVLKVAQLMKETLDEMKIEGFAKTSGSSGLHIFAPIQRKYTFEQAIRWAQVAAEAAAARNPKIATTERRLAERGESQVYIDWQQNAVGKSIAAVYTAREKPKATVSAPVTWAEIEAGFKLTDFTIETMPDRIHNVGDLWELMLKKKQTLPG